jgi:protein MpaA
MRKSLTVALLVAGLAAPAALAPVAGASARPAEARVGTVRVAAAGDQSAVLEKRVIGTSVKGRKIWAFHLGNPRSSKKVLLISGIHGDERASARTLRALRDGRPIDRADIWVVPVMNPDGVARDTRKNARGVDLNRNFSTGWKKLTGATNSGRKAFSEPETRAIRDFADEIEPRYTVSYHQPLNGIDIRDTGNKAWAKRLAKEIRLPKKAFDCFSACHGTYSMWFRKHHRNGAVITVELPAKPSTKYVTRIAPRAILRSVHATR